MTQNLMEHEYWDEPQGEPTPMVPGTIIGIFPVPGNPEGFGGAVAAFIPRTEEEGPQVVVVLPSKITAIIGLSVITIPVKDIAWHHGEWHFHANDDSPSDVGDINWKVKK